MKHPWWSIFAFYWKRKPTQVFSCEYCEVFKNTYFEKHLLKDASASVLPCHFIPIYILNLWTCGWVSVCSQTSFNQFPTIPKICCQDEWKWRKNLQYLFSPYKKCSFQTQNNNLNFMSLKGIAEFSIKCSCPIYTINSWVKKLNSWSYWFPMTFLLWSSTLFLHSLSSHTCSKMLDVLSKMQRTSSNLTP